MSSAILRWNRSLDVQRPSLYEPRTIHDIDEGSTGIPPRGKCVVMEGCCSTKRSHKEWRRTAKKERRRRLRRKAAAEREADAERLTAALEKSADYLKWLEERELTERENDRREKEEHEQRERLWLEEEVRFHSTV